MARHHSSWQLTFATLGILVAATWSAQNARGTDYDFVNPNNDTSVDWHTPTYWNPMGVPSNSGDTATFTRPTEVPSTTGFQVIVNSNTTIGGLTIDSTNYTDPHTFTIDGFGRLIFQDPSGTASYTETANHPSNLSNERVTMVPDIEVLSDLVMTMNHQADLNSSSFFNGAIIGTSARTITLEGTANLQLAAQGVPGFEGRYIINGGGIRLTGTANLESSAGVTVNSGGQLQFNNNNNAPTDDWGLANGAVLNLNGPGRTEGSNGALRFQGQNGHNPRHAFFHNEVVLQSDATIAAGPGGANIVTGELDNVVSGPGGLTKNGPGNLIISNPASSWDGDTHANEGMLSVTNPIFADSADVYLVSGGAATLNLNFTGMDVVRSFFIDDVAQAVGLWGMTGNPLADFTTDWITGDGLLDVQSLGTLSGDHNGDGVVDAADYALWRSDPNSYGNQQGYDDWVDNFGQTAGSGSGPSALSAATVAPEPGTSLLALFALAGLFAVAKRREKVA